MLDYPGLFNKFSSIQKKVDYVVNLVLNFTRVLKLFHIQALIMNVDFELSIH
jgi:hypothetical protein